MASADSLQFVVTAQVFFLRPQDLPGYSHVLSLFTCRIYHVQSVQLLGFVLLRKLTLTHGLICDSCSSGQSFVQQETFQLLQSGFLQIPPHDGHPCLRLTLPAAGWMRDLHPLETCAAGRTMIKAPASFDAGAFFFSAFLSHVMNWKRRMRWSLWK